MSSLARGTEPNRPRTRHSKTPRAAIVLADRMRARIIEGGWPDGASVPESTLVASSGFSRATVREALRLLEADGLAETRRGPGGGIKVTEPGLAQVARSLAILVTLAEVPLADLFAFRILIEPAAAHMAAVHATGPQRDELVRLSSTDGGPRFADEVAFHTVVAEAAHNELIRIMMLAPHELLRFHLQSEAVTPADVAAANRAHRAIAQAIGEGDETRAERTMRAHLSSFEALMREHGRLEQPIVVRDQFEEAQSWLR